MVSVACKRKKAVNKQCYMLWSTDGTRPSVTMPHAEQAAPTVMRYQEHWQCQQAVHREPTPLVLDSQTHAAILHSDVKPLVRKPTKHCCADDKPQVSQLLVNHQ